MKEASFRERAEGGMARVKRERLVEGREINQIMIMNQILLNQSHHAHSGGYAIDFAEFVIEEGEDASFEEGRENEQSDERKKDKGGHREGELRQA